MLDPGAGPALSPPAVSHTSTQQWQSFEMRMRHRRAERCVLRAEVALEAGFEDDARAALEEARRLNSQTPDFETLRATVTHQLAVYAGARRAMQRRRIAGIAAAALLLVTIGTSAFWTRSDEPAAVSTPEVQRETAPVQAVANDAAASPTVIPAREVRGTGDPKDEEIPKKAIDKPEPARPAAKPVPRVPPVMKPAPTRSVEPRTLRVPPAPALPGAEPPAAPSSIVPIERVLADLPVAAVGSAATEEPGVRAALAKYESAYSGLNPSAARAVWPGVDERSLARAFDSLESQRVALGRCSVRLDGAAARADCSGSVSWTPKVGGGTQSQARQWQFELTNANGAWLITRAEAK